MLSMQTRFSCILIPEFIIVFSPPQRSASLSSSSSIPPWLLNPTNDSNIKTTTELPCQPNQPDQLEMGLTIPLVAEVRGNVDPMMFINNGADNNHNVSSSNGYNVYETPTQKSVSQSSRPIYRLSERSLPHMNKDRTNMITPANVTHLPFVINPDNSNSSNNAPMLLQTLTHDLTNTQTAIGERMNNSESIAMAKPCLQTAPNVQYPPTAITAITTTNFSSQMRKDTKVTNIWAKIGAEWCCALNCHNGKTKPECRCMLFFRLPLDDPTR